MNEQKREALAASCHEKGYNCCQSVLLSCGDLTGLDEKTAAALGYGFGGGMHCGSVCGALSGGLMAIGAACLAEGTPQENRPSATALSRELERRFQERFGSMLCQDILKAAGRRVCNQCIAVAGAAAADIIRQHRSETAEAGILPIDKREEIG